MLRSTLNSSGPRLPSFSGLSTLTELHMSGCSLLEGEIPSDIGFLSFLKLLDLAESSFTTIPANLKNISDGEDSPSVLILNIPIATPVVSNHIDVSFRITNPWLKVEKCGVHVVNEFCPTEFDDFLDTLSISSPRDWDSINHKARPPREGNTLYGTIILEGLYKMRGVKSCGVNEFKRHPGNSGGHFLAELVNVTWYPQGILGLPIHNIYGSLSSSSLDESDRLLHSPLRSDSSFFHPQGDV
ncbi:hypothetical protein NL676_024005 [Syzygium grande]|nr:hypothetical protein NL676_024005 [Syzygium grande]